MEVWLSTICLRLDPLCQPFLSQLDRMCDKSGLSTCTLLQVALWVWTWRMASKKARWLSSHKILSLWINEICQLFSGNDFRSHPSLSSRHPPAGPANTSCIEQSENLLLILFLLRIQYLYRSTKKSASVAFLVQAAFYMTTGITISIAIIILLGIVRYAQKKKLLFIIPGNAF